MDFLETVSDNIPLQLREKNRWVMWAFAQRNGSTTKVPFVADLNRTTLAAVDRKETWRSFETAWKVLEKREREFCGIGFVFDDSDGLVGIDIDECYDHRTDVMISAAEELIAELATYAEFSPSYLGVKLIGTTSVSLAGLRKTGPVNGLSVEIYNTLRYFAITGCILDRATPRPVTNCDEPLRKLLRALNTQSTPDVGKLVGQLPENPALRRLLEKLKGVRRSGDGWQARCPAHADRNPSLSINVTHDRILIHCHKGCAHHKIVQSMGLQFADLFL